MTNKIFDFLPRHLKNRDLASMMDVTLERVFSKGTTEKVRAFVGRKERGIYDPTAKCYTPYLTYPGNSSDRKNYGFEPVFSNTLQNDQVFYDDLLNSLYNKGSITFDNYRLLDHTMKTVNLPIDTDKFINYEMYYWLTTEFIHPDLPGTINTSDQKHYVTIDKPGTTWWSQHNSWYHYNDIKDYIDDTNSKYALQGKRPIVEFDSFLELSDDTSLLTDYNVKPEDFPFFKLYIWNEDTQSHEYDQENTIFQYVENNLHSFDDELEFNPKLIAGDYLSEYVFIMNMNNDSFFKRDAEYQGSYISTNFDYRNIRQEFAEGKIKTAFELTMLPTTNAIDVFVNGRRLLDEEYTISGSTITLVEPTEKYSYVDFHSSELVLSMSENAFQKIHPSIEYNPDNDDYMNKEFKYSIFYEHMHRLIETTPGLSGDTISFNTFRLIGDNTNKTRFNDRGSVMIRSQADIEFAYFASTRDDYNPFEAVQFLATAYSNYKHRLITHIEKIISDLNSDLLSDTEILEQAIYNITLLKKSSISMFSGQNMLLYGKDVAQYEELPIAVIDSVNEQFMPVFETTVVNDPDLMIFLNGNVQRLGIDYTISNTGGEVTFINYLPVTGDEILVRHYYLSEETYVPSSATKLGIAPAYIPEFLVDTEYDPDVTFLVGHDGSKLPIFGTRVDNILYEFETRIYNNLENKDDSEIRSMEHSVVWSASTAYSRSEKNFMMYPIFKNWMMHNNVDNLTNTDYDTSDWKTWNYSTYDNNTAGHWRGIYSYLYGTDMIFAEPWKILKVSQKPDNFDTTYGNNYTTNAFWTALIADSDFLVSSPVDVSDNIIPIDDLVFSGIISANDIGKMKAEWSFGDGSPIEQAWKRTSDYPFALFLQMILQKPFEIISEYEDEVKNLVRIYNKRDNINTNDVLAEKDNYQFKLGSKLAGFVNNFNLLGEDTSLRESEHYQIPSDNYDLFVHAGEPNRSEFYSAIILEKVSLDLPHPDYSLSDVYDYRKGDIVLNTNDGKYYRRKIDGTSASEDALTINFDYTAWVLISQPHTKQHGYRIYGYDSLNPVFYALDWERTSKPDSWSAEGNFFEIDQWTSSTFYKKDSYIQYNSRPYVCIDNHQSSTSFEVDLKYWKQLVDWPRKKLLTAHGFEKNKNDVVIPYQYGQVLTSLDDIAHLFIGYQEYLKLVGWSFDTADENGNIIDFETKLVEFLEWAILKHDAGDFIILTPMLASGRFNAPYGTETMHRETFKNFYRVVDAGGRLIPEGQIEFYTDQSGLSFKSNIPIHGMKVDIADVEHAFVVDRVDNYGDVIYDPLSHDRNLRMLVDCNRTIDWDGTLSADGFLVYNNSIVPNFDTLVEDTRNYRNNIVDQNLSIINSLKGRQIGFSPRTYLDNFGMERESQLEFYRGFIVDKGSVDSANRILNCNSKITSVDQSQVWAFKVAEYGGCYMDKVATTSIKASDMKTDPHVVTFDTYPPMIKTDKPPAGNFKTSGYVREEYVNYIVPDTDEVYNIDTKFLREGDTVWTQFDADKEWDVLRLSETAELNYIKESKDGQLIVGLTNVPNNVNDNLLFLRIVSNNISPNVKGYYRLVWNTMTAIGDLTIFEYLVFSEDYDPLIVEIDDTTSNSLFVPIPNTSAVSAIGSVSNPDLNDGDVLMIDGDEYVFSESAGSSAGIHLYGSETDPLVTVGDKIKMVGIDKDGNVINPISSVITFDHATLRTTEPFLAVSGDVININGETLIVENASEETIRIESLSTEQDILTTGNQLNLDGIVANVMDITVTGVDATYPITVSKPLSVNGTIVTIEAGMTLSDVVNEINSNSLDVTAYYTGGQLNLTTSSSILTLQGSIINDLGLSSTNTYFDSKISNLVDTINSLMIIGLTASVVDSKLILTTTEPTLDVQGTAAAQLGIPTGIYESTIFPTIESLAAQINRLNISTIDAAEVNNRLEITTTGAFINIIEVTDGALERLGYNTSAIATSDTDTYVKYSAIDQIAYQLANAIDDGSNVITASVVNRKIQIHTGAGGDILKSLVVSNVSGTALTDIGITAGNYTNIASANRDVEKLRDSINSYGTDVIASVGSGGKIILNVNRNSMNLQGTESSVLIALGLRETYTAISSNSNFKIMDWKSLRFIPNQYKDFDYLNRVPGTMPVPLTFDDWYQDLGLNDTSYIFVDDWEEAGYAVLYRDTDGTLDFSSRQCQRIDTDKIDRVIVKDADEYSRYDLYDPLNLKMPADLINSIDYITWKNPAIYSGGSSSKRWYDEKLGIVWWDTELARFYRYYDFGNAYQNPDIDYMKSVWGKMVPGSRVVIKEWTSSFNKPNGAKYNSYKIFDANGKHIKTKYFYWKNSNENDIDGKVYNTKNIKSLLESKTIITDRFIPVSDNSIIITNNRKIFKDTTIDISLQYDANATAALQSPLYKEWELVSEELKKPVPEFLMLGLQSSISNIVIDNFFFKNTEAADLINVNYAEYFVSFLDECNIRNVVITINNSVVPSDYIELDGNTLKIIDDYEILEGDVLRVYKTNTPENPWFDSSVEARQNFASILNDKLDNRLLSSVFPDYEFYINLDSPLFEKTDWAMTDKWADVTEAAYITRNPSFDMNALYDAGYNSFKVITPEHTSYYFEVDGELRLVKRTNSAIKVIFDDIEYPEDSIDVYYENAINVQVFLFIEMMYKYMDDKFLKYMFFEMIKYMLTEKTYPDWIFKTSYQDFIMTNTTMRQYTVYQRDSYDDVIDYIMEAKPYHVKIRSVDERYSLLEETINTNIDSLHEMDILLKFGIQSYGAMVTQEIFDNPSEECYTFNDIFNLPAPAKENISVMIKKVSGEFVVISPTDYTVNSDGSLCISSFYDLEVGDHIMIERTYSRYTRDVISGGDHEIDDPANFPDITDGEYNGGLMLPIDNVYTNFAGGFDTGLLPARMNDLSVVKQTDFTDGTQSVIDKIVLWVYDQYGRGYKLNVKNAGTISSIDSNIITVNQSTNFKQSRGKTIRLVAIDNGNNIEFVTYNKKNGTDLMIEGRGQYTGMSYSFSSGDTIYTIEDPITINDYNQPEIEV